MRAGAAASGAAAPPGEGPAAADRGAAAAGRRRGGSSAVTGGLGAERGCRPLGPAAGSEAFRRVLRTEFRGAVLPFHTARDLHEIMKDTFHFPKNVF